MPIRVEIEGHTPLEFPDGTDQSVIQAKVHKIVSSPTSTPTPTPASGSTPQPGPTPTPQAPVPSPQSSSSLLGTIKDEGPAIVGATALGIAGTAAGVAMLPVVGLAALGGAAGEAYKQLGQQLSGSLDAPRTSIEAAKRIAKVGAEQGAWELVGGLMWRGAAKVLAPFKGNITEGVKEAKVFFGDRIKPLFLPAEATESRVMDLIQNIAEASIFGGNVIAKYKVARGKFFDDFADNLIARFGNRVDPSDLGELFVASIERGKKLHSEASKVLYNTVSDLAGSQTVKKEVTELVPSNILGPNGKPVMKSVTKLVDTVINKVNIPTKSLKDFANGIRLTSKDINGVEAKNAGDDLVSAIMDLPNTVGFDTARELRSRLMSRVDEFSVLNRKAPAIGKAKKLINLVDQGITDSLRKFDGQVEGESAYEAWRLANRFYKWGQKRFNNTMLRRLTKFADDTGTGAEMIAPAIFKPGQISRVSRVKRAVDPATWKKLQGYFMEHLLQKSTGANGDIAGKRLLNNISGRPGSFGIPMLKKVFSSQDLKAVRMFGKAVQIAQEKQAEGAGRMLIQLVQAGAVGSLALGKKVGTSSTIIFGPTVISHMILNPTINKLLIEGISMPVGSREAAVLLTRISAASMAYKENK